MKLFAFYVDSGLTDNWHSGGGVVVSANTEEEAKRKVQRLASGEIKWYYEQHQPGEIGTTTEDVYIVFPDAGCC